MGQRQDFAYVEFSIEAMSDKATMLKENHITPVTDWPETVSTEMGFLSKTPLQISLEQRLHSALENILHHPSLSETETHKHINGPAFAPAQLIQSMQTSSAPPLSAINSWKTLFTIDNSADLIKDMGGEKAKSIALAPTTNVILENIDWFKQHFHSVRLGDNIKAGQIHEDITIETVDELVQSSATIDCFLMTTDTPEIQELFANTLPQEKTTHIYELRGLLTSFLKPIEDFARADRILQQIENSENPLVVLGKKLQASTEPLFAELDTSDFDVFVLSQFDRMESDSALQAAIDAEQSVRRNAILSFAEILYVLTHLKKGSFWIYYDFFYSVGWDVENAIRAYAFTGALLDMATRPVILGMYDVIKPVCFNMDKQSAASALYKIMVDKADALVLTSKSDHIAEYLRNTLAKDKPVLSFYRYSVPSEAPKERLSNTDGERHIVGVTSFLGEVYEPNRIETRNSIRSMLQQKIHFHYYSNNAKVVAFFEELPAAEQKYFHMEQPIWDQAALIHDMSQFDGGWLVGDEASIFANMIRQIEDRNIRELYTLFVPNGVPTSSMAYGAAGLPVFISRQIKVMDEVYPDGCCIPLDMGEVDNLSNIFARLDWKTMHQTMRAEKHRFDISQQVSTLANFLREI